MVLQSLMRFPTTVAHSYQRVNTWSEEGAGRKGQDCDVPNCSPKKTISGASCCHNKHIDYSSVG